MEVKKLSQRLQKLLKQDRGKQLVLILGLCGIALIYFSGFFPHSSGEKREETAEKEAGAVSYERELEKNLTQLVSAITGEEDPKVMVTLESSARYVYASDEKSSVQSEGKEEESAHVLLRDSSGTQQALKVTEIQPKVKGVVVVSRYAGSASMRKALTQAVKTVLSVSSRKVCVVSSRTAN